MIWLASELTLIIYVVLCQELIIRDNDTSCTLATPNISFTSRGNFIELPKYILEEIGPGDIVQVGYTQILGVFDYIGCSPETDIPANSTIQSTYPDPGQCYSLCRTKYFALNNKRCICLPQRPITTISAGCNRGCTFPKYTACGGADIDSAYLSVYEYIESLNRNFDDGCYCYTCRSETNMYEWKYCGDKLTGLCNTGGAVVDPGLSSNWKDYTVQCFARKYTLVDGRNIRVLNGSFDAQYMWVGSIKTFFIESLHATELLFPDQRGFIRLDHDSNRYILAFNSNTGLVGSKFLCMNVDVSTGSTTEINQREDKMRSAFVTATIILFISTLIFMCTTIVLIYRLRTYKIFKCYRECMKEPYDSVDTSSPLTSVMEMKNTCTEHDKLRSAKEMELDCNLC